MMLRTVDTTVDVIVAIFSAKLLVVTKTHGVTYKQWRNNVKNNLVYKHLQQVIKKR